MSRRAVVRRPAAVAALLLGPGVLWLTVFLALPLALIVAVSVMERGTYGGVAAGFTLAHYRRIADPLYLGVAWRSLAWATLTTALCLGLGFPVALAAARARRARNALLLLVVLPLWTSFLVRTYAIMVLLRDDGVVNHVLRAAGLVDRPLQLLYTPFAVLAGLVFGHLALMILPLYASLEKLDPSLLEAAETLGARGWARFTRIIIPQAMPGIAAGSVLVFVPALGAFLTPDLLGGAREMMLGTLIQNQFGAARNWPFGAALSSVLTVTVLGGLLWWQHRRRAGPER